MRFLLLLAILAAASPAFASDLRRGNGLDCGDQIVLPMFSRVPGALTASAAPATAETVRCTKFTAPCNMVGATRLGFVLTAQGAANSNVQVGIYNSAGTLIAAGDVENGNDANGTSETTASLAYSLLAGNVYYACYASSVTATLTVAGSGASFGAYTLGSSTILDNAFNAGCTGTTAPWACCTASGMGTCTGTTAQFNDTCTASTNPYPCCSGANAGTCTGLPAALGALQPAAANISWAIVVAK